MKYINKMILENFQSHKYSEIEFDQGLNIIVGPSDSGKTAIIRALKWVLYNEPSGDYFIREGENHAAVTIVLSDNTVVKRSRSKSKNTYSLIKKDGEETVFEGFGTSVPLEIIEETSIKKINLDDSESNAINLGEQLEGAFLLSERTSVRASAMGRVVGVNIVDDALKETLRDLRSYSIRKKTSDNTILDLKEQLDKYDYLDNLKDRLSKTKEIRSIIENNIKLKQKFEKLQVNYTGNKNEISKLEILLDRYKGIDELQLISLKLEALIQRHQLLFNYKNKLKNIIQEIDISNQTLNSIPDLELLGEKYSLLEFKKYKVTKLIRIDSNFQSISKDKEVYKKTYDSLRDIGLLDKILINYQKQKSKLDLLNTKKSFMESIRYRINYGEKYLEQFNKLTYIEALLEDIKEKLSIFKLSSKLNIDYRKCNLQIEKEKLQIEEYSQRFLFEREKYKKLLTEIEVCPYCLSKIDDTTIYNIVEKYNQEEY